MSEEHLGALIAVLLLTVLCCFTAALMLTLSIGGCS
jgi:hypothetical protein